MNEFTQQPFAVGRGNASRNHPARERSNSGSYIKRIIGAHIEPSKELVSKQAAVDALSVAELDVLLTPWAQEISDRWLHHSETGVMIEADIEHSVDIDSRDVGLFVSLAFSTRIRCQLPCSKLNIQVDHSNGNFFVTKGGVPK